MACEAVAKICIRIVVCRWLGVKKWFICRLYGVLRAFVDVFVG